MYWLYYSFFNLHSKDDVGKTESFFSLVYWLGLKESWGRTRVRGIWSVAFHLEWGKVSLKSPSNLTFISPGLEFALMVISTSNVRIEAVNIHSLFSMESEYCISAGFHRLCSACWECRRHLSDSHPSPKISFPGVMELLRSRMAC